MKHALIALAILGASLSAQAETGCTINKRSPGQSDYERTLYIGTVTSFKYLLIKRGSNKVEELSKIEELFSTQNRNSINGATVITVGPQENQQFGITVSTVDMSKSENVLPLDAVGIGSVQSPSKVMGLVLEKKNLSITCYSY